MVSYFRLLESMDGLEFVNLEMGYRKSFYLVRYDSYLNVFKNI